MLRRVYFTLITIDFAIVLSTGNVRMFYYVVMYIMFLCEYIKRDIEGNNGY